MVGALNHLIKLDALIRLPKIFSEQQMVDCVGFDGCGGASPGTAWLHAATVGRQDSSSSYPYQDNSKKNVTIWSFRAQFFITLVLTSHPYMIIVD